MNPFDLQNSPLTGTNLIEASAGTGKTYTLSGLFLRLILEKSLTVDRILVVTFTEAATDELKDRIRRKLREAITVFSEGYGDDDFLVGLLERQENPDKGLELLKAAIRDFDESAIFTIHSFCKRMLHEYAFESGSLFDTELLTDQEALRREIVEDFWRRHFYAASPLFVNYAVKNISPDKLRLLLRNTLPDIRIIPDTDIPDSGDQEEAYKSVFEAVSRAWLSAKSEVSEILLNDKGLNRSKYKASNILTWISDMDRVIGLGSDNPFLFEKFEKFTTSVLSESVKKNSVAPSHSFFDLCETLRLRQSELCAVFDLALIGLKIRLFQYAETELRRRKETQNIRFFDDLLLNLHDALRGENKKSLAEQIRSQFKAALIDEFQDTDPIQYEIFNTIFGGADAMLFLIGDPKQAIYAFRGADVFAYMNAKTHADSAYTLLENWRSDPALISAVNAIFSRSDKPFIYDEIPFRDAIPASKKSDPKVISSDPPMRIWFANASDIENTGKAIPKGKANRLIVSAVAAEISRLLTPPPTPPRNGEGRPLPRPLPETERGDSPCPFREGGRGVRSADIAVLVLRNQEAALIQKALSDLNIPSVLHSTGNLFDSYEAIETERVLSGIAEPHSERNIRAALATDIMGMSGMEMLSDDESAYEQRLIPFKDYYDLWHRRGFIRMFQEMMRREKVMPRLMKLPDGERRITNLLHLAEVLHQVYAEKKLSMTGLVKWLSEQKHPDTPRSEEHQLRLESDAHAVRIVTVHKSKGLEYPIVFCPFMWNDFKVSEPPFLFHDENHARQMTLDLGSPEIEHHQEFAEKERLAENLRLLYVALTRAKHRCYLVWGRFNKCEASGMAYLLHNFKPLSDQEILDDLSEIRDNSGENIFISEISAESGQPYSPLSEDIPELRCRKFTRIIDQSFRVSSFSSLVMRQQHGAELPDYDAADREKSRVQDVLPFSIHAFPRGAKTGLFLHEVFQHSDFTGDLSGMETLVAEKLKAYNFEDIWQKTICEMVQKVLATPLDGFSLSQITNEQRLNELEFYFPLKLISPKTLKDIFSDYSRHEVLSDFPEQLERLYFSPVKGFMKGFMDLVFEADGRFYLADWKSNFLGGQLEDYHPGALTGAMTKDFYILQYHLYTLALHQYLRVRIPDYCYETHFGGVFYIFLRGVDPAVNPEFGIFRDKPPEALINALSEKLIGGE